MTRRIASLFLILLFGSALCRAENFIAGYQMPGKFLLLGQDMRGADGNLKPFARMTPGEIATIYHELWHAYFIECESRENGKLFRAFRAKVDRLYAAYPADKRMEIHEEAVAEFIDAAIATSIDIKRFLATKSPEKRKEILEHSAFPRIYAEVFQDQYTGYYTRSVGGSNTLISGAASTSATLSVWDPAQNPILRNYVLDARKVMAPFLSDAARFGLPVAYLDKALGRLRGIVFLTDTGLPLPAQTEVQAFKQRSDDFALTRAPKPENPVPSMESRGAESSSGGGPGGHEGAQSAESPTIVDVVWGRLVALASPQPQPQKPLQADVVMVDIPLDRDDIVLIERTLFEGRIPEDPRALLSIP